MQKNWFLTARSLLLTIALHVVLGIILLFGFEFSSTPKAPQKSAVRIVNAVSVDKQQVELELTRLKRAEDAKKVAALKELDALKNQQKKAQAKLNKIRKKQQEEERKNGEAKKKRIAEQERLKQLEKQKLEEKAKRKEKQIANEKKSLKDALALEAAQEKEDNEKIQLYADAINRAIRGKFNIVGLPKGLSCEIQIRMFEGGRVADVAITKSSGNELFDKRAENAVYAASPLPAPNEERFSKRLIITFKPQS